MYGTHAHRAPSARNTGGGEAEARARRAVDDAPRLGRDHDAAVGRPSDSDSFSEWSESFFSASAFFLERAWLILYAGNIDGQYCTDANGGAGLHGPGSLPAYPHPHYHNHPRLEVEVIVECKPPLSHPRS